MNGSRFGVGAAIAVGILALLSLSGYGASVSSTGPSYSPAVPVSGVSPLELATHATAPLPAASFSRTVLVESFTGVWCIHCPAETQAMHNIAGQTSNNVITIGELHVCAFAPPSPCLDNFVPSDTTSTDRGNFYKVCGYPDVYFDGQHDACGAGTSVPAMQNEYQDEIANASAVPTNLSIAQSATITEAGVVDHVNVTSGANGSYNEIVYLMEAINKMNQSVGYGPHDVDTIVRETLYNHPVTLTPGTNSLLTVTRGLNTTYNPRNLSVIAFIQQNSTKLISNANWSQVTTLAASVSANRTTLFSQGGATITVVATNSTTGAPIPNAAVNLAVSGGGLLTPTTGLTGSDGSFNATLTAPWVTAATDLVVSAQLSANSYHDGTGATTILVNPVVAPDVPTGIQVLATNTSAVWLNWTASASGGAGVTYHVYRAASQGGSYTQIATATSPTYQDTAVTAGTSYWYKVSAQNVAGFSANTSGVAASSVTAIASGLPASVGWWFSIDGLNSTSPTNGSMALYLPSGFVSYEYGPASYAYVVSAPPSPLEISGASVSVQASFTPRYASLQGTVNVAGAKVTANGVTVPVSGEAFGTTLAAGTYWINVTATGYVTNSTNVTLTPGNLTTVSILLTSSVPSGHGGSTPAGSSGLTTTDFIVLAAIVVVAGATVVGVAMVASKRKGGGRNRGPQAPGQ